MEKLMAIAKLIPVIIEIIKSIEASIPGQGKGEAKLAALREILELMDTSVVQFWPTIEKVVAALVKLFNATQMFNKG